jgi:hypothetical protein
MALVPHNWRTYALLVFHVAVSGPSALAQAVAVHGASFTTPASYQAQQRKKPLRATEVHRISQAHVEIWLRRGCGSARSFVPSPDWLLTACIPVDQVVSRLACVWALSSTGVGSWSRCEYFPGGEKLSASEAATQAAKFGTYSGLPFLIVLADFANVEFGTPYVWINREHVLAQGDRPGSPPLLGNDVVEPVKEGEPTKQPTIYHTLNERFDLSRAFLAPIWAPMPPESKLPSLEERTIFLDQKQRRALYLERNGFQLSDWGAAAIGDALSQLYLVKFEKVQFGGPEILIKGPKKYRLIRPSPHFP